MCLDQKVTQINMAFKPCSGLWGRTRTDARRAYGRGSTCSGRLGKRENGFYSGRRSHLWVTSVGEGHVKGRLGC